MVIYIDKTIGQYIEQNGMNDEERNLFNDLASSHSRGRCLLCGDLSSLEKVTDLLLDESPKATYSKIKSQHFQTRSIIEQVKNFLVISCCENADVPDFFKDKYKLLNISDAIKCDFSAPCTLVGENFDDCKFYKLLAERYLYSRKLKGVSFSFHNELGGGNTINKVFEKCVKEDKYLTFCIVDSDKKYDVSKRYPNKVEMGDTAKQLQKTYKSLLRTFKLPTYGVLFIPVHEIENLIPISVLELIAKSSVPEMVNGLDCLKKLLQKKLVQAILSYDFKKGNNTTNAQGKAYWEEIGEIIGDTSFPAINSRVLEHALNFFESNTDPQYDFAKVELDEYLIDIWENVGADIFSWGCSNYPIRS